LKKLTGFPVKSAGNLFAVMQNDADFAAVSGSLRDYSLSLIQIANDLRLLSSGPNTGFGEILLPALQPGSSIMPGKVNPVLPEVAAQVGYQVVGNDVTIAFAAASGECELNVMRPESPREPLYQGDQGGPATVPVLRGKQFRHCRGAESLPRLFQGRGVRQGSHPDKTDFAPGSSLQRTSKRKRTSSYPLSRKSDPASEIDLHFTRRV
jgi:hypothetical protein